MSSNTNDETAVSDTGVDSEGQIAAVLFVVVLVILVALIMGIAVAA